MRLLLTWLLRALLPFVAASCFSLSPIAGAATPTAIRSDIDLSTERIRDPNVWVDRASGTYYMVSTTDRVGPNRRPAVVAFTSKDLKRWNGPHVIFEVPEGFWAQKAIWAPELHSYKGKFYLLATFSSDELLPEQWRDWLPRVKRGTQVLVADSPLGPFKPFENRSTLPTDMMTLDGTLWEEDGVPYMVFAHEWVQVKDGTIEYVPMKGDLSATAGEPKRLFHASDATWTRKNLEYGSTVTDAPWLYRTRTGKLLMLWSSFGTGNYTVGIATSQSGKLAGPWIQQDPIYTKDGGHPMLFKRLDGQLMMILHSPNKLRERAKLFEVEDLGDTLRVKEQ